MPDLSQSLQGRDLGHLRIVAELWKIELNIQDTRTGLDHLVSFLRDPNRVNDVLISLPTEALVALDDLIRSDGRMLWSLFRKRYGEVREIGPGRRDRDQPYMNPISPTEMLWYRALLARSFFDTPQGMQEFAYIPDDLLLLLPIPAPQAPNPLGRPATNAECAQPILATDHILDHSCTYLSALRSSLPDEEIALIAQSWITTSTSFVPLSPNPLSHLLSSAGLLDSNRLPQPEATRQFLEASRSQALAQLAKSWLESTSYNDLRLIPGLVAEGEWQNDPLRARRLILDFLSTAPYETWWSLPAFVTAIHETTPDFQRPAGDYDSWFIRAERTGEYLRGFEHWDEVDGELIRYIITGPLHWLGIIDLASSAPETAPTALRFSKWAMPLLSGTAPEGLPAEEEIIKALSDARLRIPRLAPRATRYQIARFCTWEGEKNELYTYRLTPTSLERAHQQGLSVNQLLTLLRRYAQPVPPSLVKTLERWEAHGTEAHMEQVLVLRVSSPEILIALRGSRAARFLGDPLGVTTVIIKPGAAGKIQAALAELGYLAEMKTKNKE